MKFIDIEDGVEKFTCILNSFFTDYKEDKNKIDELYQYYFLSEYRLLNNKKYIYMSINLIVQSGLKLVSDERRNLLRVKEILLTLKIKGFLGFEINDKFDNNTPLLICLNKEPDVNKKDNFTMLYRWMFEAANDPKEFFVYAYIAKWSGVSGYKISLNEWADALGYSNASSVQRYLTKLEKDKKLIVEHGQYILQNRQDMNKYSMNKEVLKDVVQVKSKSNKAKIKGDPKEESNAVSNGVEKREHSWYSTDKKSFPDSSDYYIFITTTDEKLKKHAASRIDSLRKSEWGLKKVDENMDIAERKLYSENKEKEIEQQKKIISESKFLIAKNNNHEIIEITPDNIVTMDLKWFYSNVNTINVLQTKNHKVDDDDYGSSSSDYVDNVEIEEFLGHCKVETSMKVWDEFKRMVIENGKLEHEHIDSLIKLRESIINENNKGLPFDVAWEGDDISCYDGRSETNSSLSNRRYKNKVTIMQEEERKKRDESVRVNSLFD